MPYYWYKLGGWEMCVDAVSRQDANQHIKTHAYGAKFQGEYDPPQMAGHGQLSTATGMITAKRQEIISASIRHEIEEWEYAGRPGAWWEKPKWQEPRNIRAGQGMVQGGHRQPTGSGGQSTYPMRSGSGSSATATPAGRLPGWLRMSGKARQNDRTNDPNSQTRRFLAKALRDYLAIKGLCSMAAGPQRTEVVSWQKICQFLGIELQEIEKSD